MSNVIKIRPVGAELFQADRRTNGHTNGKTDMTKLIVAFRNFAPARKYLMALPGYEPRSLVIQSLS